MDQIKTPAATYTPPATAIMHHTQASFTDRELPQPVHLVQYDDTVPILAVELSANGQPYSVPAGAALNIRMDKRDGHYIYNPALGLNEGRTIAYIAVTQQMATGAGVFYPILEVVVAGAVAGSAELQLCIDKNPVPQDAIESTDEFQTIQQLALQAQAAADAAAASQAAAAASETAAEAAKTAAEAAQASAAGSASAAAASATQAAADAATATQKATEAAASATQAAADAATATQKATEAAASATAAQEAAKQAQEIAQGAKGYFETPDALRDAYPTGQAGWWAIVGTTDSIWVWDADTGTWKDSGQSMDLSDYYTKSQVDTKVDAANSAAAAAQSTANTAVSNAATAQTAATNANNNANAKMPIAGGTFTGDVVAINSNRTGNCVRNIYINGVNTNYILMVRK